MAFRADGDDIHASAITNKVTVTERLIFDRLPLVERETELLIDPRPDQFEQDGASDLQRILIPNEFREIIGKSESLVIDVDRKMARVQWEMLPSQPGEGPLGVTTRIARQLSTPYSPRPDDTHFGRQLSFLVIGDPDNKLPEAHDEARAIHKLLQEKLGPTAVMTLIGPPEPGTRRGTEEGFGPADYFQVVKLLLRGRFDVIHYCGHADFDPATPDRAGWDFRTRPPHRLGSRRHGAAAHPGRGQRLLDQPGVAAGGNRRLCHGKRHSLRPDAGGTTRAGRQPRRRVLSPRRAHYIGTAWEVPSVPARDFAIEFYTQLLDRKSVGESVLIARKRLHRPPEAYPTEGRMAWAAYQHYGDPSAALEFVVDEEK